MKYWLPRPYSGIIGFESDVITSGKDPSFRKLLQIVKSLNYQKALFCYSEKIPSLFTVQNII